MSKLQEHLVNSTNDSLPKQEHWSQDTLDVTNAPSENAALPSLSALEYKLSPSESTSLPQTLVIPNEISPPRPVIYIFSENAELRISLPPKTATYNAPPEHSLRETRNTVYEGSPPLSPITFHFDEDDLSETEDTDAKKIKFHQTEIEKRVENGQYDEILETHVKALIVTYEMTTDLKLILLYAIMCMGRSDWQSIHHSLLPLKFDANAEPEFNIAVYLLRAQVSLQSPTTNPNSSPAQSCRRAIKLCEQYKARKRVDAEMARNLDRWSNAAYKILLQSMGPITNQADQLYWDSKCQENIRDPVLRFSAKLQLRVMHDNQTSMQVSGKYGEPEERELLDPLEIEAPGSRSERLRGNMGATLELPQSVITEDDEEVLRDDYKVLIEKDKPAVGVLTLQFPHRENLLRLLETSLQSGMYGMTEAICQGDCIPLIQRNFAFDHPPIDPFAYHPPYANMIDALIPVQSALPLLATLGNTREDDTDEWDTTVAANCVANIAKKFILSLTPPPLRLFKPLKRLYSGSHQHRHSFDEEEEEEDDDDEEDEEEEEAKEEKKDDGQLDEEAKEACKQIEFALRISISLDNHLITAKLIEIDPPFINLSDGNRSLIHLVIRTSYTADPSMLRKAIGWAQPDLHNTDSTGRNILHYAAYYSIKSVEAMRCLVEYHKCRECWGKVAEMRGVGYTPFQMVKVARRKYRIGDAVEDEFVDEFVKWILKNVGPWVVDPKGEKFK
ncbi:hypothetical protein AA313_de0205637 [Arthrobotrys entomopaga]|nr:hypothetical protein AA313_de0205637 [Arthrobotrys entomopaga]